MTNYVYIATSLDGYIATADGGIDWLFDVPNPEQSDYGYALFINGIDAIVMGRSSFEKVLTFDAWPYEKPVFVLSTTLSVIPEQVAGKVEIVNGDLLRLVADLSARGYRNLYIDGGLTIQSFLALDLIDVMIITRFPILLGDGFPLFGKLDRQLKFSHQATEVYSGGLTKSHYIRNRG